MASSTQIQPLQEESAAPGVNFPWVKILWFSLLLIVMFYPVLTVMVKEWYDDENMGHGFFVPVVAGYIAWQRREDLAKVPMSGHWSGYALIVWGLVQLLVGTLGADFFVMRTAFLATMLGVLVALTGWQMVKALAFPLFLLLFMIRIPLFIYQQITFPLQLFASQIAEISLSALGIPVLREGNILELANQKLSVVEACSGIRSLLSLSFLSLVYGYFFDPRPWMRGVLLICTVPIAIGANAARVTITGIISAYKREWAEGVYHSFEGWVIFLVALIALVAVHKLISRIVGTAGGAQANATV
jgi:exosortase